MAPLCAPRSVLVVDIRCYPQLTTRDLLGELSQSVLFALLLSIICTPSYLQRFTSFLAARSILD